jgi:UbiD family decarboxylase
MRTVGHTVGAWMKLLAAGVPGVKELYITPMSCAVFVAIVSVGQHFYKGQVRQIMNALWTTRTPKWVIVVDDDIDIFQSSQVEWALSTRVQPHRDIFVTTDEYAGVTLDPSIEPAKRDYPHVQTSVVGIDATKHFKGFDFPPEIRTRPEELAKIEARWKEYGIS